MGDPLRYRRDGDRACIDVRLEQLAQLFDGRDPAPFRARDLDPSAVQYILDAAEEIPGAERLHIVLTFTDREAPSRADEVRASVRAHFEHERAQIQRRSRRERRRASVFFVIGVAVLTLLLTAAELVGRLPAGSARNVAREGLVITAWVVLWRPLESLLYDWWPSRERTRQIDRILDAEITVRALG